MIISGNSDAKVLVDQEDNGGLKNFFLFVMLFLSQLSVNAASTEVLLFSR